MSDDIPFNKEFAEAPGVCVALTPLVRRILCRNPSPFTFKGTCTYLAGRGDVVVVDPGPDDPMHVQSIIAALAGETIAGILVTHTHRDHSPGARRLAALTGAPVLGCGPHRAARLPLAGESARLDASGDADHAPARILAEGESISAGGATLTAIETPGHSMNHLCFALAEERVIFSGDHVMAWSTSIVAPPDGSMSAYMVSLEKLKLRGEKTYFPGHGGLVTDAPRFVRALYSHRRQREASILQRIRSGDQSISDIVPKLYAGLAPALMGAARLSVFAHVEDLVARRLLQCEGDPLLESRYRPV